MTIDEIIHFLKWLELRKDVVLESTRLDFAAIAREYIGSSDPFALIELDYEGKLVRLNDRAFLDNHWARYYPYRSGGGEGWIDFSAGMIGHFSADMVGPMRVEVKVRLREGLGSYSAFLDHLDIVE